MICNINGGSPKHKKHKTQSTSQPVRQSVLPEEEGEGNLRCAEQEEVDEHEQAVRGLEERRRAHVSAAGSDPHKEHQSREEPGQLVVVAGKWAVGWMVEPEGGKGVGE